MSLNQSYLDFYKLCENYFTEEFKFKPFRKNPDRIETFEANNIPFEQKKRKLYNSFSIWRMSGDESDFFTLCIAKKNKNLTQSLIAYEVLQSFLCDVIRSNPLLKALIFYRLIHGKSFLNQVMKNELKKFYNQVKESIEQDIANDDILHQNFVLIDVILPKNNIENSFQQNIFDLANLTQFFTSNDTDLIDAVITDNFLKQIDLENPTKKEMNVFLEAAKLFLQTKKPFSKSYFIKQMKLKYNYSKSYIYQTLDIESFSELADVFEKLKKKSISFTFQPNYPKFGISSFFYYIRFSQNINIEILNFCFRYLNYPIMMDYNFTQDSPVVTGKIRIPTEQGENLINLFLSLKNLRLIKEFLLIKYENYRFFNNNIIIHENSDFLNNFKKGKHVISSEFKINYSPSNYPFKPDIIDFLIINTLMMIGLASYRLSVGEERLKIYINILNREYSANKVKLKEIENLTKQIEKEFDFDFLENYVFPNPLVHFIKSEHISIDSILNHLSKKYGIVEIHFYIETLQNIYSSQGNLIENDYFSNLMNTFNEKILRIPKFSKWINTSVKKLMENRVLFNSVISIINNISAFLKNSKFKNGKFSMLEKQEFFQQSTSIFRNYLDQSEDSIWSDYNRRVENLINQGIISPKMITSMWNTKLYINKIFLLENIDINNEKFKILSKYFPYLSIYSGSDTMSNKKFIVMNILIDSSFDLTLNHFIIKLFQGNLVFCGIFFGELYYGTNINPNLYNFKKNSYNSITHEFNQILLFLKKIITVENSATEFLNKLISKSHNNNVKTNNIQLINQLRNFLNSKSIILNKTHSEYDNDKNKHSNLISTDFLNSNLYGLDIKDYRILPNPEKFGFNQYILQYKLIKSDFEIYKMDHSSKEKKKWKEINTNRFLLCPGVMKLQKSSSLGFFQNIFLHYIFPKGDPPLNLLKYALRRKLIESVYLYQIISTKMNINPNFFQETEGWKKNYNTWDQLVKKILSNPNIQYTYNSLKYELSSNSEDLFGKDREEFEIMANMYDKNVKKFINLKSNKRLIELLRSDLLALKPFFNLKKLKLTQNLMVIYRNIDQIQKQVIISVYSVLPIVQVHEFKSIDIENSSYKYSGLLVEIFVPNSRIDQIFRTVYKLNTILGLNNFQFIPNVFEFSVGEFTSNKVRKLYNPFRSHNWNKRTKKWHRIKYFDENGIPLSYHERKKEKN